jgi:hypothetical protein
MMETNSNLVLSDEAISTFWRWFSDNHHDVEALLDSDDTAELSLQINAQINLLSSQLAWEIGPGLVKPYMLVFPTAGDRERKMAVGRIMEKAPWIERWEFHASRPTRPFQPEIQLPDRGLSLRTSDWHFAVRPSATSDRFDLQIYDDKLASFDERTALSAAFILLDAVLGEDIVERWIGNMKVLPACISRETLPMPAIADRLAELIPR